MRIECIPRRLVPTELWAAAEVICGGPLNDLSRVDAQAELLDGRRFPRAELSSVLVEYNRAIGNDDLAMSNASVLADPGSVAVVTGQQAGLFSGPAYTIYKAVTAIKLAKLLETRLGRRVVPIFWNATEDHDLSEVASCKFPETTWTASFPDGGLAAESFNAGPVEELLPEFLSALPDYVRGTVSELLRVGHENYGEYASSVLARTFAGTGLVVLEPKVLRPLAEEFVSFALTENDRLRSALDSMGARLRDMDIEPGFSVDDSSGLFEIDADGKRLRLSRRDGGFERDGVVMSAEDVRTKVDGSWSTAAWLRPVLQNAIIPTAAFVAGPGEVRYHLQLKEVFAAAETPMAPMWLRNHGTVFGGRETKLWHALGWGGEDLFRSIDELRPSSDLPQVTQAVFETGKGTIDGLADTLLQELTDYGCTPTITGFRVKALKEFEKIRARVVKECQRREGIDNNRVDKLRGMVRPGDDPQERTLNVFSLVAAYGPTLIRDLLMEFDPCETGHYLFFKE